MISWTRNLSKCIKSVGVCAIPELGVGLSHHRGQQVLPDLLLHQQLVRFGPPFWSQRHRRWMSPVLHSRKAAATAAILKRSEQTHHSTMSGSFSAMERDESISMG